MTNLQLEQIIRENGTAIYSFCRHLACNVQEAEDLYQDTFLRAMELGRLDMENNPKSYLLSVAVGIWKNRKRKFAWRRRIAEEKILPAESGKETALWEEQSPEEQLLGLEEREAVRELVDRLPEKQRIVVLLFYMEELTIPQISKVLKIPAGTVKSRLHTAKKQLEKEFSGYFN